MTICWHPTSLPGPHTVDGRALWAHVVHIDMLAWQAANNPISTIIDAQGVFLAKFPGTLVEFDDGAGLWDGWTMLCPATNSAVRSFIRRFPQWVHRPSWEAVPATHRKYLPDLEGL